MLSSIRRFDNAVILTNAAAHKLAETLGEDHTKFLRLDVADGGCGGLQYKLSIDTIARDDDDVTACDGAVMRVGHKALPFVAGAKVDYIVEPFRQYFKVVDNPNATASCSCGESFSADQPVITSTCGPKV